MDKKAGYVTIPIEVFNNFAEISRRVNEQAKERLRQVEEFQVPPFSVYKNGKLIKRGGMQ